MCRMKYVILAAGLLFSSLALANPWVTTKDNVVIQGYDPVAYFVAHDAVKGDSGHALEWDGVTWYFSSQANLQRFQENPEKYAPQYGAHCANGLSDGHVVDGNPKNWRIIDGKLYLFFSAWGRAQWAFNVDEQIILANETWAKFLSQQ